MPDVAIFVFRRDLRVHDNRGLDALRSRFPGASVLPLFILNPDQLDPARNPYHSAAAVAFMRESLESLLKQTRGALRFALAPSTTPSSSSSRSTAGVGDAIVLSSLIREIDATPPLGSHRVVAVGFNADYTPFARARDAHIASSIASSPSSHAGNVEVVADPSDYTLLGFDTIRTTTGGPYQVFTPFHQATTAILSSSTPSQSRKPHHPPSPPALTRPPGRELPPASALMPLSDARVQKALPESALGGPVRPRERALAVLERIRSGGFAGYASEREVPAADATTKLSAYLKFGCVSVREALDACLCDGSGLGPLQDNPLARQLLWREFYAHLTHHFPHVLQGQVGRAPNMALRRAFDGVRWNIGVTVATGRSMFEAWKEGRTGFPLVDAAMRCLNETGFLHNRLRMVVASFLVKDLWMDWRLGERYFATRLVDYDPGANNGGWQWCASVGADAQPYFRVFSPWQQSLRFDPDAAFIKRWVPELATVTAAALHRWHDAAVRSVRSVRSVRASAASTSYMAPIVDHAVRSRQAIQAFIDARKA
jgi:deoxyribodipyrimidine photo-lyase